MNWTRKLKWALPLTLVMVLSVVFVVLAAEVVIDDFTSGGQDIFHFLTGNESTTPVTVSDFASASNAMGEHRDICLYVNGGDGGQFARYRVTTSSEYMSLELSPGVSARAYAQWDGSEASCAIDDNGLDGENLVDGTNSGFVARIIDSDGVAVDITVKVYEDNTSDWVEQTIQLDTQVQSGLNEVVDLYFPFNGFSGGTGAGTVDFTNVGAVELELDSTTEAGADVIISFFSANDAREYGDLPDSYGTNNYVAERAAFHIPQGLRLGRNVDIEASSPSGSTDVDVDDETDADDDDGVFRTPGVNWTTGPTGGHIDFSVEGCNSGNCALNGWIDWNYDGDFTDPGELVVNNRSVGNGSVNNLLIPVPLSAQFDRSYIARFRICPSTSSCNSPTATGVIDGEIEDYLWVFGPTAVTLANLEAQNNTPLIIIAAAALLVTLSGGAVLVYKRSRK